MDATMIDEHLENIDRRLTRLEQILPTLATKDELKTLATKEDLRTAIADAVAPLATKEELREEGERLRRHMDDVEERSRRYMDVLTESLREDIHLIAAHVASAKPNRTEP